jgi:hypothetical protein
MKKILFTLLITGTVILNGCGGVLGGMSDEEIYENFCDGTMTVNDIDKGSTKIVGQTEGRKFEQKDGVAKTVRDKIDYLTLYNIEINTEEKKCEYPDWDEVGEYEWVEIDFTSEIKDGTKEGVLYSFEDMKARGKAGNNSSNMKLDKKSEVILDKISDERLEGRTVLCGETFEDGFIVGGFSTIVCD